MSRMRIFISTAAGFLVFFPCFDDRPEPSRKPSISFAAFPLIRHSRCYPRSLLSVGAIGFHRPFSRFASQDDSSGYDIWSDSPYPPDNMPSAHPFLTSKRLDIWSMRELWRLLTSPILFQRAHNLLLCNTSCSSSSLHCVFLHFI
jgi:hypothetical protein